MADYDIAIIGAGIVGSSLAARLAPHGRVFLVDRDVRGLPGSTGHAPGFVGQLNQLAPLTELAKRTVAAYLQIPGGFDVVGGLEIATSAEELAALEPRAELARSRGLRVETVDGDKAKALAPAFVEKAVGALHFPDDGTANARVLAHAYQDAAAAAGARLVDADVSAIEGGKITTSAGTFTAAKIAVCTGVWSAQLLPLPAAVSVAHPYAYSVSRPAREKSPFIRWPAAHVYARDHGVADGIGSYDHDPVHVSARAMDAHNTATGAWDPAFDDVIERALALLPAQTAAKFDGRTTAGEGKGDEGGKAADAAYKAMVEGREGGTPYAFNGLFQVTPDGMPLVGRVKEGIYAAVGVWVTQGAGSAGLLADMILEDLGKGEAKDAELRAALDPLRFAGKDDEVVETALATYNDIYNKEK
jgi:sarcosine oxidase